MKSLGIILLLFIMIRHQYANPVIERSKLYLLELEAKDKTLHIISSINGAVYSKNSKTASIDDDVKLSVVFWKSNGYRIITHSEVKDLNQYGVKQPKNNFQSYIVNGSKSQNFMIPSIIALGEVSIKWYKVEEANGGSYDNTKPEWHWDDIPYKETEIIEWRDKFIVTPDVTPTIFDPVYCDGKVVGTMRYKAVLTINGETYSTPGKDSKYKGSISDKVHRISFKGNTDNEVINYAFAMCNLPYIWGSESFTGSKWDKHQAELFIGADCADFAVAAHQLAGKQLPYDSIKYLSHTLIVTTPKSKEDGNYLNNQNNLIKVGKKGVQSGDFIYWNYNSRGAGHVGLFYEDKSNPNGQFAGEADGIFNAWDLVIHTLFHEPEIKPIGEAYHGNIRVYRFKE